MNETHEHDKPTYPPQLRIIGPEGTTPVEIKPVQLLDLLPQYERTQKSLGRQPEGIKQYCRLIRQYINYVGDATLLDFHRTSILDYRDDFGDRNCESSTVINALAALSSFAGWMIERRYISEDPTTDILRPKKKEANPQPLGLEQIAILLEAIEEPDGLTRRARWTWRRNRRVVYLALFAGLRREELRLLQWSQCHLFDKVPMIRLTDGTKNRKPRRVAIHRLLREELLCASEHERQPDFFVCGTPAGDELSRAGIEHIFDRWLRTDLDIDTKLGAHLHPHKLRTTFATRYMQRGGHILALADQMGHKDIATLKHYVLNEEEDMLQQIEQLDFGQKPNQEP